MWIFVCIVCIYRVLKPLHNDISLQALGKNKKRKYVIKETNNYVCTVYNVGVFPRKSVWKNDSRAKNTKQ